MKIIPQFKGVILKGRFWANDQEIYDSYIQSFEGKTVEMSIREWKKERSDKQNRYYWGVIVKLISESTGYSDDETHSILSSMFLKDHKELGGKRYTVVKSTTSLKTDEFKQYTEECKRFAATELGIFIPDPTQIQI